MDSDRFLNALEALAAHRAERALGCDSTAPEGECVEIVADSTRVERLVELRDACLESRGGERFVARALELRAALGFYLERASAEPDAEIRALRREAGSVEAPVIELARTEDPRDRERLARAWIGRERPFDAPRAARRELRRGAARALGAESTLDLLDATGTRASSDWLREVERSAISPLDGAVDLAARAAWRRHGLDPSRRSVGDAPRLEALARLRALASDAAIRRAIGRLGRLFGIDPDAVENCRLLPKAEDRAWARSALGRSGAVLIGPGAIEGPSALAWALGATGVAVRGAFVASARGGVAARFADPAFEHAASALFRRTLLCPRGRSWLDLPESEGLADDLAFLDAVVPRRGWAYLERVVASQGGDDGEAGLGAAMRRATGGPATPVDRAAVADDDPAPADLLRGLVYGLLIEERLRTRFGRTWFLEARARRWLREIWEAEPETTADSMAEALSLGRMEPTPLVDACRPRAAKA